MKGAGFISLGLIIAMLFIQACSTVHRKPSVSRPHSRASKPASEIRTEAGKIVSCDLNSYTVAISLSPKKSVSVVVDKNTNIINKDKKSIDLASIRPGDVVTVSYESKGGKNIAKYIKVF
jgi:hypothetical protein